MHDLKCGQKDCVHNHGYCCCADSVAITQDTDCSTYNCCCGDKLTEAAKDYPQPKNNVDTDVYCNAPCVFNKSTKCVANGITVSTCDTSTGCSAQCLTFVKQ